VPIGPRFLRPPRVVEQKEIGDDSWLVRGQVDVAPTMEWLAEELLPARVKAGLPPDEVHSEPVVFTIDEQTVARYERRVLVR